MAVKAMFFALSEKVLQIFLSRTRALNKVLFDKISKQTKPLVLI